MRFLPSFVSGCWNCGRGGDGEGLPAWINTNEQRITVKVGGHLRSAPRHKIKDRWTLLIMNVSSLCLPQARRRHAGLQAWVRIQSGVYRKRVHEVERGGKRVCKRLKQVIPAASVGETPSSRHIQVQFKRCVSALCPDDGCWNAGTDSWWNHQKGADHQRGGQL